MGTDNTNIAELESVAGELTEIIQKSSLAYQVCGVQYSTTPNPLVFGVKKNPATKGFTIESKTPEKLQVVDSEGFTEEMIDDVFALFGENAVDYLKTISANDITDTLDAAIVTYMQSIATEDTTLVLDFATETEHNILVQNLMIKINKSRMAIADSTKRGFPKIIIASSNVCALLLTHKMISNEAAADVPGSRENIKFIGGIADALVFLDIDAVSDYVLVSHKTEVKGDAAVILIPTSDVNMKIHRNEEDGSLKHHYNQRFAYSRNPLDESGANDSLFVRSFDVTLTGFAAL